MRCIRPTQFPNAHGVYTSCGQCMPCRITRKSEWVTKLLLEWKTFPSGAFVTLTYAPEFLPNPDIKGGNLQKDDVQKFLKRFRKNYQAKYGITKIRYLAVGEYGERSSRAHYHLLFFNVDPEWCEEMVKKSWTMGLTQTDELNQNRIKYTVGYTIKKMTSEEDFPDGRQPEFSLASKNPGLGWYSIPKLAELCFKHGKYPLRAISSQENWILKKEGFEVEPWDGVFYFDKSGNLEFPISENYTPSPGASYCRLDNAMMARLSKYMRPDLKDYVEARTLVRRKKIFACRARCPMCNTSYKFYTFQLDNVHTPETFKIYRSIAVLKSSVARIKFLGGDEYEKTVKKSEKINRQSKKTRTI